MSQLFQSISSAVFPLQDYFDSQSFSANMDHQGQPLEEDMGLKQEELPQMDGSCDACEPDEAQPATHVCHTCSFAFCPVHAGKHARSTRHTLKPYDHEEAQANGPHADGDSRSRGEAENEPGGNRAVAVDANQEVAPLGAALANGGESAESAQKGSPQEAEACEGAEDTEAGPEAVGGEEAGKRDTVTVERLRCKEHGEEGSLYCKPDEQIICVVCAVQGEHREHEIITLHEAYVWQKVSCVQQHSFFLFFFTVDQHGRIYCILRFTTNNLQLTLQHLQLFCKMYLVHHQCSLYSLFIMKDSIAAELSFFYVSAPGL